VHAAGLLQRFWAPPPAVRDLRAVAAQRTTLRRLATQARNGLHAALLRAPDAAGSPGPRLDGASEIQAHTDALGHGQARGGFRLTHRL
jgi:hypothetical protein